MSPSFSKRTTRQQCLFNWKIALNFKCYDENERKFYWNLIMKILNLLFEFLPHKQINQDLL
jgi:hypothetical protein